LVKIVRWLFGSLLTTFERFCIYIKPETKPLCQVKLVQSPDSRFIKTSLTLLNFVWNYYFFTLKIWTSSSKVVITHNSYVCNLCSLSIRCQKIWMNWILQNHEMRIGDKQIYILSREANFEGPLLRVGD